MKHHTLDAPTTRLHTWRSVLGSDWHWLAALGMAAGISLGLAGFLALDAWWWLPLWGLVFLGLGRPDV